MDFKNSHITNIGFHIFSLKIRALIPCETFTRFTNIGYQNFYYKYKKCISELILEIQTLDIRTLVDIQNIGYQNFSGHTDIGYQNFSGHTNIGFQNFSGYTNIGYPKF